MNILEGVDRQKIIDLGVGVLGIYLTYLTTGVFHEWMMKLPYTNRFTNQQDYFTYPFGFLIFPTGITWIIGQIINSYTIDPRDIVRVPSSKYFMCAFTVAVSTVTYTYAIYLTSFPIVMMVKSCNILSVIIVGVFCSQVKQKKLKLEKKKLIVGAIVTMGIIIFKVSDPKTGVEEKTTQFLGIFLLLLSLVADGFLPDLQAAIKSDFKPQPMDMMAQINKWVCIIAIFASLITFQFFPMLLYIYDHGLFWFHMLSMGVLSTLGQMFVYRMIKQFKQHIVPFVITTRKIVTVGLSILYFHHQTNILQIFGIIIVFSIVTYEFVTELMSTKDTLITERQKNIPKITQMIPKQEIDQETKLVPRQ